MLLEFPLERPIFIREYATRTYKTLPYFLSKAMVELPITFAVTTVVFLIAYWIMKLQGSFIFLVLISWLLGLVASSTALVLGCALPNVKVAIEVCPGMGSEPFRNFGTCFSRSPLSPSSRRPCLCRRSSLQVSSSKCPSMS